MAFHLFPQTSAFSAHFKDIANDVIAIMQILSEHFDAPEKILEAKERAKQVEKHADATAAAAIRLLNVSFITPFDRDDIHYFIHELDDIIDLTEDIIKNIYLYGFTDHNGPFKKFSRVLVDSSQVLKVMIESHLDPPRYSDAVAELKQKLHTLEDEGDEIFATAIHELFESERDPITLMKGKEIIEMLENVTDKCRSVGNTIENILLKSQ